MKLLDLYLLQVVRVGELGSLVPVKRQVIKDQLLKGLRVGTSVPC